MEFTFWSWFDDLTKIIVDGCNGSNNWGPTDAMVEQGKCAYVVFDKMPVRTVLGSVWNCAHEVFDKKTVRSISVFFKQWDP